MPQQIVEEILRAEDAWFSAALAGDVAQYERILAPNFTFIMHGGDVFNRERFLASVRSGLRVIRSMEWSEFTLHPYETSAVVIGTVSIDATLDGREFRGPSRTSRAWIKLNGVWQVALMHSTDARIQTKWEALTAASPSVKSEIAGHVRRQMAVSSLHLKSLRFSENLLASKEDSDFLPRGKPPVESTPSAIADAEA